MLTGLCQRPALSSLWRFLLESCFGKNRKTAESDKTAGSLKQTTRLPLQVARFFLALMGAAILSVFATSAQAQGQNIEINSNVGDTVYGNSNDGGVTANTTPENNTLTVNATVTGGAFGAYSSSANATDNTLIINATGEVTGSAFGGQSSPEGVASNNTVIIDGGRVGGFVFGGETSSMPGGTATDNTVILKNNPTIGNTIFGGSTGGTSAN